MSEILSLSKARRAKAKAEKEQLASQNRVKFGRTKSENQLAKAKDALAAKRIDGHRRNSEESEG